MTRQEFIDQVLILTASDDNTPYELYTRAEALWEEREEHRPKPRAEWEMTKGNNRPTTYSLRLGKFSVSVCQVVKFPKTWIRAFSYVEDETPIFSHRFEAENLEEAKREAALWVTKMLQESMEALTGGAH